MSETYYRSPYSASGSAGRWNPKGTRMICASGSPGVALLEYLCIKGHAVAARHWYMIVYDIADETVIGTLDPASLPVGWDSLPHSKATQDFGRLWLADKDLPFLKVPSARIGLSFYPLECNLLINPDFPNIEQVLQVEDVVSFDYLLNTWKNSTNTPDAH